MFEGAPPAAVVVVTHAVPGSASAAEKSSRQTILNMLSPPGCYMSQDTLENRFAANYDKKGVGVPVRADLQQKYFGRSYKQARAPEIALDMVLDWMWDKHQWITGNVRPPGKTSAALSPVDADMLFRAELGTFKRARIA